MSIKIECDNCDNEIKDESYCPKCFQELQERINDLDDALETIECEMENREVEIENLKEQLNDKL